MPAGVTAPARQGTAQSARDAEEGNLSVIGNVSPDGKLVVRCRIFNATGKMDAVSCFLDTGMPIPFMIPEKLIKELGLKYLRKADIAIGLESTRKLNVYEANFQWLENDVPRQVEVCGVDQDLALAGMGSVFGYKLTVDIVIGGAVSIEPLPK